MATRNLPSAAQCHARRTVRPVQSPRTRAALVLVLAPVLAAISACGGADRRWVGADPLTPTAVGDPGSLPPSVTAASAEAGQWACTFRFTPQHPARSVALAGTFNGWSPTATPCTGPAADGSYAATVRLPAGTHAYKFVVDGGQWIADPLNPDRVGDNHGGDNSVLFLGRLARLTASPAAIGDGRIDLDGFEHLPHVARYFQRALPRSALVRCRLLSGDVQRVSVVVRGGAAVPMHVAAAGPLYTMYETLLATPADVADRPLQYTFILEDGALRAAHPATFTVKPSAQPTLVTPAWARHAVWYQIMLDRFRNGDPANDPDGAIPWTHDWFSTAPGEATRGHGSEFYKFYVFKRMYGGDLAGLRQKLDYLRDLGVNALYLNPIFKAPSHHKYDATSYIHVDDHFGVKGDYAAAEAAEDVADPRTWTWTPTDRLFLDFLRDAKARGFRVIIDGVFNHVGVAHPAFQDVRRNGKNSRFADWFNVTSWEPFEYRGWAGYGELPEFRKDAHGLASRAAAEHIFAVTRRWMDPNGDGDPSDGIDGWRLDVPTEIPAGFWVEWSKLVKSINPDAYITGEIWDRADAWLDGTKFDAVMNYQFARPVVAWICHKTKRLKPSEVDARLAELRLTYPPAATAVMQNLVDSHDTDRVVSMAQNPDREYDIGNRVQDSNPSYDNSKPGPAEYQRARLVALLQMTYVGAPMIYYGDEVGMWGADDPTNRKPMLWRDLEPFAQPQENFVMTEHLACYRELIALRRRLEVLRTGDFESVLADDAKDVWAFARRNARETALVFLNASDQLQRVIVKRRGDWPAHFSQVFGPQTSAPATADTIDLTLSPISGVVLHGTSAP
ncbi:MAG: hypothetical protein CHACPFDD_00272 [Phycisphaerae bacterium]|nr:hypothetical protein [Phycisphaerae bacterium]